MRATKTTTRLPRIALGLTLTPLVAWVTALLAPRVHVGAIFGNALAFAGGAILPIGALALAATTELGRRATFAIAGLAAASLLALTLTHPAPLAAMLLVDAALVALGWALGASIGRRVQHAAHLLPACVVAACADLVSLLSPEGPTHAIAQSERALSVLATWFPVPGTNALAPALGVGDLLFSGLIFGVAVVHELPYLRTLCLAIAGASCAGALSAWLEVAVPALVPIGAAIVIGLPAVRRVRPADRAATKWSLVIASAIAIGVLARHFASH
ncbi:MAG TPA: hypothetical protein VHV51_04350 [Polyangiaceae bacterium]|jgi:hypothetical protein|nr:hypothetical protein [Polyangiaceae bacterium]